MVVSFQLLNITVSAEPMNVSDTTRRLVCLYAFKIRSSSSSSVEA